MKPHPSAWTAVLLLASSCIESPTLGPDVFCDEANRCVGDPGYPLCDPFAHKCVPADAAVGAGCMRDAECLDPATPVCDVAHRACALCKGPEDDGACRAHGGGLARCQPATGRCGACRGDTAATDCAAATPVCDLGTCRACRAQAECESSVCRADGACAPEEDVAYVDNRGKACDGPMHTGTRADPYCEIADAVKGIGKRSAVRVAASTMAYHRFDTTGLTAPLLLVGAGRAAQPTSTIADASGSCIEVVGGTDLTVDGMELARCQSGLTASTGRVTLRRSLVHDNDGVGVTLSGGASSHVVDASIIRDNKGGGLGLYLAGYEVKNCYLARNRGTFGGVFIDLFSKGRFAFNTVRDNVTSSAPGGIQCQVGADTKMIEASIVFDNGVDGNGRQLGAACAYSATVTNRSEPTMAMGLLHDNPSFDGTDYRLKKLPFNPQLVDAIAGGLEAFDIDGTPRPQGKGSDIGCFEVKP